jgi:uncharacterized LabA/DUF88 family protein
MQMSFYGSAYSGPKEVHYLFIDGAQLQFTLEEVGRDWFGTPIEIDYSKLQGARQKVFYYDCLPAIKEDGDEERKLERESKRAFFNHLRSIPGWHVSEGLARHRRRERQQQKEVDILIAVDMLTHTHRKNMHRLTFLSGDQDFAPLLEAVVREGMYVELLYPEGHTAPDLMHFADTATPLNLDALHFAATDAFQRQHTLPVRSFNGTDASAAQPMLSHATHNGEMFAYVWQQNSGEIAIQAANPNSHGQYFTVWHQDGKLAQRYFLMHMMRLNRISADSIKWVTVS